MTPVLMSAMHLKPPYLRIPMRRLFIKQKKGITAKKSFEFEFLQGNPLIYKLRINLSSKPEALVIDSADQSVGAFYNQSQSKQD